MKYFDVTDPVELGTDDYTYILVTNHGPGTSYPRLKFSVRRWYGEPDDLKPGKGVSIHEAYAWDLIAAQVRAAIKAEIPLSQNLLNAINELDGYAEAQDV